MPNLKNQRFIERIQELIAEGHEVAKLERPSSVGSYFQDADIVTVQAWLTKVGNIIESVFGKNSSQYEHFQNVLPKSGVRFVEHSYDIHPIIGVLAGGLDDLEKGYLLGQEYIIASEIFDNILEQAKHLNKNGYKDPSAVLCRVVLEDALIRIARDTGVDVSKKTSIINDELKKKGRYPQPRWRLIQAWLDIGNAAAHGNFEDFSKADVTKMIEGIEQFLALELQ